LPYAFELTGIKPRMYAMLHAQSVDKFDFTYPMRDWIRHFEVGIGKILSGIFVTSTCLMDLCAYHNVGGYHNIYLCGLPYNSAEVREHFPLSLPKKKQNQVIYSSRWDTEKDPGFFMDVMEECINQTMDVHFVITTSSDKLRSNDNKLLERLGNLVKMNPNYIEVRTGCTKEEYYYSLLESKIQMNTADQDFVSWTLLEATTCGCRPLYPNFLSFPEALHNDYSLMYEKRDIKSAVTALRKALATPLIDYSHIYKPFDDSWKRMLSVMTQDFNFWLENPLFED
jgi:glycosyltransferase involved in cell wall biosynthesis